MANNKVELRYLSQAQVQATGLDMAVALQVVEEVLRLHVLGEDVLPHKISLDLGEPERGVVNIMPGYPGGRFDAFGVKWIGIFPNNPQRYGLPSLNGLITLGDAERGMPLAVMDTSWLTSLRTGAASGVAAKYLARPAATTAAILGAGTQGHTQVQALKATLPGLQEVRVYDVRAEAAARYAEEMGAMLGLAVWAVDSPERCVAGADVIVTATVADEAIVKDAWVKDGSLFVHVGSNQEEEYGVILHSDGVYVDDWPGMVHRRSQTLARMRAAGLIDDAAITAELGEVIAGSKPGRRNDGERLYFCSVGMGTEDTALAQAALRLAESKGIGTMLPLFGT